MRSTETPGDIPLRADGTDILLFSGTDIAKTRLLVEFGTGLGTWRYDRRKGFPWQNVLDLRGTPEDLSLLQGVFAAWLRARDFVLDVTSVSAEYDRRIRSYSIAFTVRTRYGEITDTIAFGV